MVRASVSSEPSRDGKVTTTDGRDGGCVSLRHAPREEVEHSGAESLVVGERQVDLRVRAHVARYVALGAAV